LFAEGAVKKKKKKKKLNLGRNNRTAPSPESPSTESPERTEAEGRRQLPLLKGAQRSPQLDQLDESFADQEEEGSSNLRGGLLWSSSSSSLVAVMGVGTGEQRKQLLPQLLARESRP